MKTLVQILNTLLAIVLMFTVLIGYFAIKTKLNIEVSQTEKDVFDMLMNLGILALHYFFYVGIPAIIIQRLIASANAQPKTRS